jgi:polysaccharide export outer membrane protein
VKTLRSWLLAGPVWITAAWVMPTWVMPTWVMPTWVMPTWVISAMAQQRPAAPAELGANLPAQQLGPGDLLAVSVYGAPELTRTVRVGSDGWIRLPMLAHLIEAKGRMPVDVEAGIREALNREGILVDPVVTVTVAEYNSRPISVAGSVRRPLTFQALGPTSLLEALTRAEGLTEDAGKEILVTRRSTDAADHPLMERVQVQNLIQRGDPAANLVLEGGEEIRVPPAGRVYVVGNVKKPGAFRVEESTGMTVLRALAMAEGLTPYSQKVAYVYRPGEAGARETPVELRKIMDRKAPDVPLEADDIFYVPDNRVGRVTATTLERILSFVAGTTSGVLIYGASR